MIGPRNSTSSRFNAKVFENIFAIHQHQIIFQFVEELDGGQHAAVRVGAATTNLQMLHWSNK